MNPHSATKPRAHTGRVDGPGDRVHPPRPSANPAREDYAARVASAGPPRRKQPVHLPHVARDNQPVILLITVCTAGKARVLASERVHETLREVWSEARRYRVGRYLIMPDHVHLFCSPASRAAGPVCEWAGYWKRLVSRRLKDLYPLWQQNLWDRKLRNARHYHDRWEYVRANPARADLTEDADDWPYAGCLNDLLW